VSDGSTISVKCGTAHSHLYRLLLQVRLLPNHDGGVFEVTVDTAEQGTVLVWSRKSEGRFPEAKELKQRVRDVIAPSKGLGHSDVAVRQRPLALTCKSAAPHSSFSSIFLFPHPLVSRPRRRQRWSRNEVTSPCFYKGGGLAFHLSEMSSEGC
jgi:selT/selW/selH-like putative selenoprotein